jgi:hypothetical protein
MRLSAKILENVSNINHWNYASEAHVYEGQVNYIYLQLVDLSKTIDIDGTIGSISDYPMRYIPQGTSISLVAVFPSIDDAQQFEITATQPFADDKSIWKIATPSSQLPKSGNFQLKLTEDGVTKTFFVKASVVAELLNIGGC